MPGGVFKRRWQHSPPPCRRAIAYAEYSDLTLSLEGEGYGDPVRRSRTAGRSRVRVIGACRLSLSPNPLPKGRGLWRPRAADRFPRPSQEGRCAEANCPNAIALPLRGGWTARQRRPGGGISKRMRNSKASRFLLFDPHPRPLPARGRGAVASSSLVIARRRQAPRQSNAEHDALDCFPRLPPGSQ